MRQARYIVNLIEGFKLGSLGVSRKPKVTSDDDQGTNVPLPDEVSAKISANVKEVLKERMQDELSKGPNFEGIIELIKLGADPDTFSKTGWPALLYAANMGNVFAVSQLIKFKAYMDIQDRDGWTALMWAVVQDHLDVVNMLLSNRVLMNTQNKIGETALMMASEGNHTTIVNALLDRGADATIKNHKGQTAFQLAKDSKMRRTFRLRGIKS
jgi:ankyrin repeat protein